MVEPKNELTALFQWLQQDPQWSHLSLDEIANIWDKGGWFGKNDDEIRAQILQAWQASKTVLPSSNGRTVSPSQIVLPDGTLINIDWYTDGKGFTVPIIPMKYLTKENIQFVWGQFENWVGLIDTIRSNNPEQYPFDVDDSQIEADLYEIVTYLSSVAYNKLDPDNLTPEAQETLLQLASKASRLKEPRSMFLREDTSKEITLPVQEGLEPTGLEYAQEVGKRLGISEGEVHAAGLVQSKYDVPVEWKEKKLSEIKGNEDLIKRYLEDVKKAEELYQSGKPLNRAYMPNRAFSPMKVYGEETNLPAPGTFRKGEEGGYERTTEDGYTYRIPAYKEWLNEEYNRETGGPLQSPTSYPKLYPWQEKVKGAFESVGMTEEEEAKKFMTPEQHQQIFFQGKSPELFGFKKQLYEIPEESTLANYLETQKQKQSKEQKKWEELVRKAQDRAIRKAKI